MPGASSDLLKVVLCLFTQVLIAERKIIQPDDGVHGRADLMAHTGQKRCLCFTGFFRGAQRIRQGFTLCHGITHLSVDIGNSHDDKVLVVLHPGYLHADPGRAVVAFKPVRHDKGVFPA